MKNNTNYYKLAKVRINMVTNTGIIIHTDGIKRKTKPKANLVERTTRKMAVTPQELMGITTKGITICLAEYTEKYPWTDTPSNEFIQQQYFMLDFDNEEKVNKKKVQLTDGRYMSFKDAMRNSFFQQHAVFMYKTFNYSDEHHKFRVVFKLDTPITEEKEVLRLNMSLIKKFPSADANCKDVRRIFYGGNGQYHVFNFNNVLPYNSFMQSYGVSIEEVSTVTKRRSSVVPALPELVTEVNKNGIVSMIANGEISELHEVLSVKEIILPNIFVAREHLKKLNMGSIFGLPVGTNFSDIFHEDDNPSSRIYCNNKGDYVYACFSSGSHDFKGDLIKVVQRIRGCEYHEALEFLFVLFKVRIKVTDDVQIIYNNIDMLIAIFEDEKLMREDYPYIYKSFNHKKTRNYARQAIQLFKNHVFVDIDTGEQRVAITFSEETIKDKIGCSVVTAHNLLVRLREAGIIRSLPDNEIPELILHGMVAHKKEKEMKFGAKQRRTSMHQIDLIDNFVGFISDRCENMLAERFSNKSNSQKGYEASKGKEGKKEIFAQDGDRESLTAEDKKYISAFCKYAQKLIEKQGYATDKDIIRKFNQGFKFGKESVAEATFRELRRGFIRESGLMSIPNNKKSRDEFGIETKSKSKMLYIEGVA